jgi:Chaperone of endosialidase
MTTFTTQQGRSFLFTEQFARQRFSPTVIASFMVPAALLLLPNLSLYGQDALRTDPNGNVLIGGSVGIGTEKPNQKLDVAGNATINGNVGIDTNTPEYALQISNFAPGDRYIALTTAGGNKYKTGIKLWAWQKDYGFTIEHDETKAGLNILRNYEDGIKPNPIGKTALFINITSGNVGIGTDTPGFPLTFPSTLGDKISLYGQSGAHYGFGIQGSLLQIHTADANSDIAFGYGKSDSLTETMRIRGNGILSVSDGLFIQGVRGDTASITKNAFINPDAKWQIKDPSKKAFTLEIRDSGQLELFGTQTNGQTDWLKMATFDAANKRIDFPSGAPIILSGSLFVNGTLAYYWGPDKQWKHIENRAGDMAGSFSGPNPPSDVRLKTELRPIPSALEKVSQLRGVTFHWNDQGLQYLTRDIATTMSAGPGASDEENRKVWQAERDKRYKDLSTTNVGVIAQDVEAVLPEAVSTDETGYKSVNYYELIPLMIEALKEEDKICQEQGLTIARQQMEMQRLTAANQAAQQQLKELQDVKQRLGHLEAAVNKFLASGVSEDQPELTSANRPPTRDHSQGASFVTDSGR